MSITPMSPAIIKQGGFKHGSLLDGKIPQSRVRSRRKSTNSLLKDGAILVTETSDIIEAIAPLTGSTIQLPPRMDDPTDTEMSDFRSTAPPAQSDRERVMEALGPTPVGIDELIRHTALQPAQVSAILLELDLAGRLERHSGGLVTLLPGGI